MCALFAVFDGRLGCLGRREGVLAILEAIMVVLHSILSIIRSFGSRWGIFDVILNCLFGVVGHLSKHAENEKHRVIKFSEFGYFKGSSPRQAVREAAVAAVAVQGAIWATWDLPFVTFTVLGAWFCRAELRPHLRRSRGKLRAGEPSLECSWEVSTGGCISEARRGFAGVCPGAFLSLWAR